MKSSSPLGLAFSIAFVITAFFAGILFLLNYIDFHTLWFPASVSLLIFFGLSFLIIYRILSRFLFEKIQPIYKTIHDFTATERELKRKVDQGDIISRINKEVEDWADKKTREIKKLKQLEKYRRDFLGNVSHELKTPIFNIQGYILTLLDGGIDDPKVNRLYLERTEKSINRMISIVEDLESISRLESGELKLKIAKFDIVKMAEDVFEMHDMRAKEKGIKLGFGVDKPKPVMVRADKQRIFDVLNNLIYNSITYGVKNGRTKLSFMDMGGNVLVDVTDNGIGIGEAEIPRIFERFYRTDKSRSRDQGGTGLGLSIVKHVIEAHKQTINVRSKINKGSSFMFTLEKA